MNDAFDAVTIQLPDGPEVLVRTWADGVVEVDIRPAVRLGPRVWTPVGILGGSFTVEHCGNRAYP